MEQSWHRNQPCPVAPRPSAVGHGEFGADHSRRLPHVPARRGQRGCRFPNRDRPGSPYRAVALPHRAPFPRNARLPLSVREPGPAPDNPAPPPPLTEFATASEKRPERDSVRRDDSRSPHRDTAHEEPSHPARAPSRQSPDEQQGRACALFAWRGDRYARRG
ncbi:unnamed protein product [Lampetra planeri]